jgi:two-component system, HptB-dependent secretion and biofilm response regulator
MTTTTRVLIVDPSRESREVLCALVERMGCQPISSARTAEAVELTRSSRPHLIVCDEDGDSSRDLAGLAELNEAAARTDTPVVLLGAAKFPRLAQHPGEVVAKPYHYAPLILRIEAALANRRAAA